MIGLRGHALASLFSTIGLGNYQAVCFNIL
jgi:hypothetical protein